MPRLLNSRKGASEIIAALLLILITIAASVLVYAYASGLMGRLQGVKVQQPYVEQIALEYYDWTSLSTLKLTLRNVGVTTITMSDFFINGVNQTQSGCNSKLVPQTGICTATITPAIVSIQNGVTYFVKIVTKDGATFSYSCIAGQSA